MKILHTSDWHLGHRLHEHSQQEELKLFLKWLLDIIEEEKIDVLLVSGDIFDSGFPSTLSQKLYYDFIADLGMSHCSHAVITGGNHDSPGNLNAPAKLLFESSVSVVGKVESESLEHLVLQLKVKEEEIIIAAIPYLRDQDIRRAISGESFDEIEERYKVALKRHYDEAMDLSLKVRKKETAMIAMGHLYAVGGKVSDSEQQIYVGDLGHIRSNDFPKEFDYIALGHLHRPQRVGGEDHIRYSGSPVALSFSELNYSKKVLILDVKDGEINVNDLEIPRFRIIHRIRGNEEFCLGKLNQIETGNYGLTSWVEIILEEEEFSGLAIRKMHKAVENLDIEILRISRGKDRNEKDLDQLIKSSKMVRDFSPEEVFEMKCKEAKFDLSKHPKIKDAFYEALSFAREEENRNH